MTKKATPLSGGKPRKSFVADFESLKAKVLGVDTPPGDTEENKSSTPLLRELPIELLQRGKYQPRRITAKTELDELADSIRELGVIEPLVVRPQKRGKKYEIIAGERRWRAAQQAGLASVPVVIRDADDQTAAIITLVENIQREDLNAIDEAQALQRLMEEFELSQLQVGELVGKSKSAISRAIGLLTLTPKVQTYIRDSELDGGHGRVLLGLPGDVQNDLAATAVAQGWSVRELEKQKAAYKQRKKSRRMPSRPDPNVKRLETKISEWLAAPVTLKMNSRGGGQIVINYSNIDTCQSVLQRMGIRDLDD